ncbi:MAG: class I SAM-dependent methyltransferase [Bacillota bacterium]
MLDVGTGVGNFVFLLTGLLDNYDEIIGIDTSLRAIEMAKTCFEEKDYVNFKQMDGNHIDYPDQYFDAVCLSNSLHHLDGAQSIFLEMKRVLKPNGIILVHEMISAPLTIKQISHQMIHHFSAEIDRSLGITHNETYTKKEIEQLLNSYSSCELEDAWILEDNEKRVFTEKEINEIIKTADQMVSRAKDQAQMTHFKEKAEMIKIIFKRMVLI